MRDAQTGLAKTFDETEKRYEEIEHPDHYQSASFEVWDIIAEYALDFFAGTAIKHILRAGKKPGSTREKDFRKAIEYLKRGLDQ